MIQCELKAYERFISKFTTHIFEVGAPNNSKVTAKTKVKGLIRNYQRRQDAFHTRLNRKEVKEPTN